MDKEILNGDDHWGCARLELHIPDVQSLKGKRQILSSLIALVAKSI